MKQKEINESLLSIYLIAGTYIGGVIWSSLLIALFFLLTPFSFFEGFYPHTMVSQYPLLKYFWILDSIIGFTGLFLSTYLASHLLSKWFVVKNINKVIIISVVILAIFSIVGAMAQFVASWANYNYFSFEGIISTVISLLIFYFTAKHALTKINKKKFIFW